jgi:2-dehydropantoate 2-reductase
MEIIVIGAGAIGSLYGARLAANNNVTLIGRSEHVAAINAHGLRIEGLESKVVRVRAATSLDRIGPNTLIIVTTKVMDTAAALGLVADLVRRDTTVLCLQNGIGIEEIARKSLGDRAIILRGITQFGAIFREPGAIEFMAHGYTLIEQHERSAGLAVVLNAAGLDCRISENIAADVWRKLVINCVVNPITAILGCEVGGIANPQLGPLKRLVIDECRALAGREGVTLGGDILNEIDDFFRPSHNVASMLQDLRRGRQTEIDYMNGAVVAIGERHGIATPANAALTSMIKAMEATRVAVAAP